MIAMVSGPLSVGMKVQKFSRDGGIVTSDRDGHKGGFRNGVHFGYFSFSTERYWSCILMKQYYLVFTLQLKASKAQWLTYLHFSITIMWGDWYQRDCTDE